MATFEYEPYLQKIPLVDRFPNLNLQKPQFIERFMEPKFNPRQKTDNLKEGLEVLAAAYHDWILRVGIYQPRRRH